MTHYLEIIVLVSIYMVERVCGTKQAQRKGESQLMSLPRTLTRLIKSSANVHFKKVHVINSLLFCAFYSVHTIKQQELLNTSTARFHSQKSNFKMAISYSLLKLQNADTSNAIIDGYSASEDFVQLSKKEGDLILGRDQEDADKLQVGIDFAKQKGVIDPNFIPEPYVTIDVMGKSPDDVSNEILGYVEERKKEHTDAGAVIVICGLSGTGKGTTVAKLSEKLSKDQEVVSWSNGNIFRSVTLLAATWCEQSGCDGFDASRALTKDNLANFMSMLSFDKFNGKFDTRIRGLGLDFYVSEIANTVLKEPKVAKNIPTVAEVTQGEVINFAAEAIKVMSSNGFSILLEGREQTVNYVRTPLRFILTLSDDTLIGKRRAAQRLMAAALDGLNESATVDDVKEALDKALIKMVSDSS